MFDHYNNFGCSFMMVWEWSNHVVGRMLGLGQGLSHFGKNTQFVTGPVTMWENTQFGIGPVTLWEEHSVWDWTGHFVGRRQAEGV